MGSAPRSSPPIQGGTVVVLPGTCWKPGPISWELSGASAPGYMGGWQKLVPPCHHNPCLGNQTGPMSPAGAARQPGLLSTREVGLPSHSAQAPANSAPEMWDPGEGDMQEEWTRGPAGQERRGLLAHPPSLADLWQQDRQLLLSPPLFRGWPRVRRQEQNVWPSWTAGRQLWDPGD